MGAVIEVVSGMKFGDFLRKEIFEPLGMNDTGFYIPAESTADLPSVMNTKMAETSRSLTSTFALLITPYLLPLSRAEQVLFPL